MILHIQLKRAFGVAFSVPITVRRVGSSASFTKWLQGVRYRKLGRESRDENALTEFDRLRVGRRRHPPRPARRAQFVRDDFPIFHGLCTHETMCRILIPGRA